MPTPETCELAIPARLANLASIAAFTEDAVRAWSQTPQEAYDIQMAVDEACANIVSYAYPDEVDGLIELAIMCGDDACTVTIHDHGAPFDPIAIPDPDIDAPLEARSIGGLGLFLMRRLMNEVRFHFDEQDGNTLTMVKRRATVSPAAQTGTP
jgi:serine/threonine-protein kinase RsbW